MSAHRILAPHSRNRAITSSWEIGLQNAREPDAARSTGQGRGGNRKAPFRPALTRARLAWEIALAGGYQTTGERATQGAGSGPDAGGEWISGRGDDQMTMLDLYGPLYDFFTSITWWQLMPHTNLVISVQPAAKCRNRPGRHSRSYSHRRSKRGRHARRGIRARRRHGEHPRSPAARSA